MRICVVGAGAIGGLLGVRLNMSGQTVSVLARGANLDAIRSAGLKLVQPDGSVLVANDVNASDTIASFGPQDIVLLALKAHQIAAIAPELPQLYHDDSVVVPLQNGIPWWFFLKFSGPFEGRRLHSLDPDGALERYIPVERIVGSIAYPAAERDAPGVVRLVEGDRFPVGELDGRRSDRVAKIAEVLTAAGFKSRVITDIRSHLWVKAWGNLAFNPISALTNATLAEICRFPPTRALAARMMLETSEVAEKLGVHLRLSVDQRIEGAERIGNHKTSMLQDLEAGRRLEVDALVGSFVELGKLTDTAMPATTAIFELVSLLNSGLAGAREDR